MARGKQGSVDCVREYGGEITMEIYDTDSGRVVVCLHDPDRPLCCGCTRRYLEMTEKLAVYIRGD